MNADRRAAILSLADALMERRGQVMELLTEEGRHGEDLAVSVVFDLYHVRDAIRELAEALALAEADRDIYRDAAAVLRDSASLYLAALRADRRSLARLLSLVSPSSAPSLGSIAEEGPLSTTDTPTPGVMYADDWPTSGPKE